MITSELVDTLEVISAREKLNAGVPRKASKNPYTKEAGLKRAEIERINLRYPN